MIKRKIALHGRVTGAPTTTVQKYVLTVIGELAGPLTAKEAKLMVFNAFKKISKEFPGAQEFWVGQPRGPRKDGAAPTQPRPTRASE